MKVLIGVSPAPLTRVVEHLLGTFGHLEVVAKASGRASLADRAAELVPDLIVTNERLLGKEPCAAIAEVKRSSPGAKVILVRPVEGFGTARRNCGADAYIGEEALVRRLRAAVRRLCSSRFRPAEV